MEIVANFTVTFNRILDANGNLIQPLPEFAANPEHLIAMYRTMTLTRIFDHKAIALQRTGQMGTYPSCLGQEAIAIGIAYAMQDKDIFCPYYREAGTQIARGVKMSEIMAYWGGDERGNAYSADSVAAHDFPICVPIASQCLHAVGAAIAIKYKKEPRVVVVTLGDGATSKGDFYEAINLAGAWELPIVFVINNNQWAISVPRKAQTHAATLAQKAIAAGIPGEQIDGNDVIIVQKALADAIAKARQGAGAYVIEAITYRLSDHTTADDAKRYRSEEELKQAWQAEPLLRLRNYLIAQSLWNDEQEKALIASSNQQVENAAQEYLSMPKQPISAIFDYHYANLPKTLVEQKNAALEMDNE